MIEVRNLTKRYGEKLAVDDMSFTARPAAVTGFLGPNGAGKSTAMRLILGLDLPTAGTATINGKPLAQHGRPLQEVGALLEARGVHPGRSARNHLRILAATAGIGEERVDEVIDLTGLTDVAAKRVGAFSLGMGQRLGIASALLGDPETLILDEPVNGLDLDGIRWIRGLLRRLADEGRTVFLSSHLMSEIALVAEHVIVVGRGRVLRDLPLRQLIETSSRRVARVRSPEAARLATLLLGPDVTLRTVDDRSLEVEGMTTDAIGLTAASAGIAVLELTSVEASLEDAYLNLTQGLVEYPGEGRTPQLAPEPSVTAS